MSCISSSALPFASQGGSRVLRSPVRWKAITCAGLFLVAAAAMPVGAAQIEQARPSQGQAAPAKPPAPTLDLRRISETFENARAALAARRGAEVLPLLSRESRRRLEEIHRAARTGDGAAMQRLGPGERFAAQGLRRFVKPEELRRMSLGEVADLAIARGWLGPNIIARSSLSRATVVGDRATGRLMVDHKPALVPADFVREGGQWRIDLTMVFTYAGQMLTGMAAMSGKTEAAYIDELLNRLAPRAGR